ncbi:MAG: hypothetical protein JNK92_13115 [Dechloromonas sp.]|nr:hypothetical protein [Dechloromonas sp.]
MAKSRTRKAQKKLVYRSVLGDDREIPAWVDDAIRKAVRPDTFQRYEEIPEFIFDLHHPNNEFLNKARPPLIERNPVIFWKSVSFLLFVAVRSLPREPAKCRITGNPWREILGVFRNSRLMRVRHWRLTWA